MEIPEKNPWSKDKNQQKTQPPYIYMRLGMEIDPGHIGGKRRSHHCAIPDPPTSRHFVYCLYFLEKYYSTHNICPFYMFNNRCIHYLLFLKDSSK